MLLIRTRRVTNEDYETGVTVETIFRVLISVTIRNTITGCYKATGLLSGTKV